MLHTWLHKPAFHYRKYVTKPTLCASSREDPQPSFSIQWIFTEKQGIIICTMPGTLVGSYQRSTSTFKAHFHCEDAFLRRVGNHVPDTTSEPEEGQVHLLPTIQLASFAPRCTPFTPVHFLSIHTQKWGEEENVTILGLDVWKFGCKYVCGEGEDRGEKWFPFLTWNGPKKEGPVAPSLRAPHEPSDAVVMLHGTLVWCPRVVRHSLQIKKKWHTETQHLRHPVYKPVSATKQCWIFMKIGTGVL